jgi:hypothetical protein
VNSGLSSAPASAVQTAEPRVQARRLHRGFAGQLLRGLGSLQLAVWLLVVLGLLTWLGTLAQVDTSLFLVQREFFESWFVLARLPIALWGWEPFSRPLIVPLPGAYPVMALLFVNLMVGGMLRLRWHWRNCGVLVVHLGIALLLIAGFVKMHYSYAGHMALLEAPTDGRAMGDRVTEANTFVSFHDYELALLRPDGDGIEERIVPESVLVGARGDGVVRLRAAELPFTVEVRHWLDNCDALPKGPKFTPALPVVGGLFLERRDVTDKRERDIAGCYVAVVPDDGPRQEALLRGEDRRPLTAHRSPFVFHVNGQRYGLDLRRVHYDLPYKVRLDEFRKKDHPGTTMARDFRSFVTVFEGDTTRTAQIYMNTPLRKDGFVFYQASYGQAGTKDGEPIWYTVLEVANNPSDKWPEYACWVIAIGLLVHFSAKLVRFLLSSTREALSA